ncbi:hypothetical protein RHGRI_035621 [Rhododendron griersonianum]|uniref:Cystatin domain-containing protein n=1 Tax=Rhododendron griersonianum TaxID=479676 RepID=A0AAV6HMT9_9ERIC|nr:hypothetical protein RHGRI_035621 [Rhododendron griersonianum]
MMGHTKKTSEGGEQIWLERLGKSMELIRINATRLHCWESNEERLGKSMELIRINATRLHCWESNEERLGKSMELIRINATRLHCWESNEERLGKSMELIRINATRLHCWESNEALAIVSEPLPQKAWGSGEDPFYYRRMTRSASKLLPQPLLLGELKEQKKRKHVDGKGPKKPRIRFRDFTIDERRDYNKRVEESEGFDVGKVPDKVLEPGLIKPIPIKSPRGVKEFNDLSRLAIERYNKQNEKSYKFVKLIRVNCRRVKGLVYYITFLGKEDGSCDPPKNFQARMLPESIHWKPKSVYLDDETRKQGQGFAFLPFQCDWRKD